jgi:hypothetical protein
MKSLDVSKIIDMLDSAVSQIEYKDEGNAGFMAGYGAALCELLSNLGAMIDDDLQNNDI